MTFASATDISSLEGTPRAPPRNKDVSSARTTAEDPQNPQRAPVSSESGNSHPPSPGAPLISSTSSTSLSAYQERFRSKWSALGLKVEEKAFRLGRKIEEYAAKVDQKMGWEDSPDPHSNQQQGCCWTTPAHPNYAYAPYPQGDQLSYEEDTSGFAYPTTNLPPDSRLVQITDPTTGRMGPALIVGNPDPGVRLVQQGYACVNERGELVVTTDNPIPPVGRAGCNCNCHGEGAANRSCHSSSEDTKPG